MSKENSYILLDTKIAEQFHKQALKTPEYPLDYGKMQNLKKELMDLCGDVKNTQKSISNQKKKR